MATKVIRGLIFKTTLAMAAFACPVLAQAPPDDVIPPDLLSISYPTITTIDARTQSQSVSGLTADASDQAPGGVASGVSYAYVSFYSPSCANPSSGSISAYFYPQGSFSPGSRQTLAGNVYVYVTTAAGTYYPCYAQVYDAVGNSHLYDGSYGKISPLFQGLLPITVITNPPLAAPAPVLTGFSISPAAADVTSAAQTFSAALSITDAGPGVGISRSYVVLCVDQSNCWYSSRSAPLKLQPGGSATNGTYTAQVKIPRYSVPGKWQISVELCDSGIPVSCKYYFPSDLQKLGFVNAVTITDTNNPDTVGPQLSGSSPISLAQGGYQLSTNLVFPATQKAANPIKINMKVTDDLSGIGYDGYSGCNPFMTVTSKNQFPPEDSRSTIQQAYASFTPDSLPNVYTATLNLPPLSEIGQWDVSVTMCDRAGNFSTFMGKASALGPQGAFLYVLYSTPATPPVPMGPPGGPPTLISDPSGAQVTIPAGIPVTDGNNVPVMNLSVSITVTPLPLDPDPSDPPPCDPNGCAAPPIPRGFRSTGSPYVSVIYTDSTGTPVPKVNLDPPGATVVIPKVVLPGNPAGLMVSTLTLFAIDGGSAGAARACQGYTFGPAFGPDPNTPGGTKGYIPELNTDDGSLTFYHVCSFSTFYALQKTSKPGDLNNDTVVDCADIDIVKASFGKRSGQVGFDPRADVTNDGVVDIRDLSFVSRLLKPGTVCK